jgi:predicted GIY-YIG superfamily endonuclease
MKKQPKLVGKIILSDFLEHSVEKFITFVSDVESSPLYKKLVREGVIMPRSLPEANILQEKNAVALTRPGVIARVGGEASFPIYYTAREFSAEYQINDEKLASYLNKPRLSEEETTHISPLLNKLRRINTRNLIIHKTLKGIVEHQRDYFASNNELNLKPLTRAKLARLISDSRDDSRSLGFTIDASRISRAIRDLSLLTPRGEEIPLSLLFASRRGMVKRCIRVIVSQEKKDTGSGQTAKAYTDEELSRRIDEGYGLSVTRREVGYCRKELGILPYFRRNGYVYHTLAANFSQIYPFTASSVESNAPATPGVYELCLESGLKYPTGCCQTFYIGSAKNLRKRLLSHLSSSSKNGGIKRFIEERSCVFRYLRVPRRWAHEEKRGYNLFVSTYGDSPLCNHMSPKLSDRHKLTEVSKIAKHEAIKTWKDGKRKRALME